MNSAFFHNRLFQEIAAEVLGPVEIRELVFAAGEVVFAEGSPGETLMLVGQGRVQIAKTGRQGHLEELSIVAPGDFFGELAVLDRGPRSATATALEPTLVGEIDQAALQQLMAGAPEVLPINFARVTMERLRSTNARFIDQLLQTERLTLLGTMLSSIVHDIKNPIAAIVSSVSYLEQRAPDELTQRAARIIQRSAGRVMLMTEELLDFARGTTKLRLQWTTAHRLLELLEEEILGQVRASKIKLNIEGASDQPVYLDEGRMTRCLANLVKNAREALVDEGEIHLQFCGNTELFEISLADSGPGIPATIRDQIFEPFVTANKKSGTGLGLAIAKSCVDAHQGKISFADRVPHGTVFHIRLPAKRKTAAAGPEN